ncbi:uncharacterized protein LOC108195078 [Daucus carota subsp. sativus]|uniref:uncharacterized protein LOC108195078 n=1 Tax=Daucus carota subsp. sativus TaxID=79200 RepID=UPI003083411B
MKVKASTLHASNSKWKMPKNYGIARNNHLNRNLLNDTPLSKVTSVSWSKPMVVPAKSSSDTDQQNADDEQPEAKANTFAIDIEFNRIDCLVGVIHEAAKGVLDAIQRHESNRRDPELAMAWRGVDVHSWHKKVAYQIAVYDLLSSAIPIELILTEKRHANTSVSRILHPITKYLGKCIQDELDARCPNLVQWFGSRMVELPRDTAIFMPMLKKWSMDYAGSRVAGIVMTISCYIAVMRLGPGRLSYIPFSFLINIILNELMNSSYAIVSVAKLHHLASEAGFEEEFLLHFGEKIFPFKDIEDLEFWLGLAVSKLSVALRREGVISGQQVFCDKDREDDLAVFGLFAFLGKETRSFFTKMKIIYLDEEVEEFLSYLEFGSLFFYPRFSILPDYQLFMEVVTDEIKWLDIYAPYYSKFNPNRGKKSRKRKRRLESLKEIILHPVLTVCYDLFVGFAHYVTTTRRPLNSNLRAFLLQSQSLLAICLECYWAVYSRSRYPVTMMERPAYKVTSCKASSERGAHLINPDNIFVSILSASAWKLRSVSTAIRMVTQLYCIDVSVSVKFVMKPLRGQKVTARERKKVERTLTDVAKLIHITILMLTPVSAWMHAAMLIAITKYIPTLIPSPFSAERLGMVKLLEKMREMEFQEWSDTDDAAVDGETTGDIKDDGSSSSANNSEETDPPDLH